MSSSNQNNKGERATTQNDSTPEMESPKTNSAMGFRINVVMKGVFLGLIFMLLIVLLSIISNYLIYSPFIGAFIFLISIIFIFTYGKRIPYTEDICWFCRINISELKLPYKYFKVDLGMPIKKDLIDAYEKWGDIIYKWRTTYEVKTVKFKYCTRCYKIGYYIVLSILWTGLLFGLTLLGLPETKGIVLALVMIIISQILIVGRLGEFMARFHPRVKQARKDGYSTFL